MTENKKYYYITYLREGDDTNKQNMVITDKHPVDFLIEHNNGLVLLYSIEITKQQCDKLTSVIRNNGRGYEVV